MISPALEPAHITVNEEDGEISLLVARAQGILGRIMVGYRTTPFTASSPEDYEVGFTDDVLMNKQIGEGKICFGCSLVSYFSICSWQDSEGMLDFLPGERLKFINVTIIDNPFPELEKIFRVELYNADGGGGNS